MSTEYKAPRPRLRTTGGIVIGQGHSLLGRIPMAIADEDIQPRGRTVYEYTGHQIIGFPRPAGNGNRKVGPMTAPVTREEAPMWTGAIPEEGCQFWLYESYYVDVVDTDGEGAYVDRGTVTPNGSPYIGTLPIDNENDPGDIVYGNPSLVTTAWLLSIVYGFEGRYYLADRGYPWTGFQFLSNPVPVWPDDYVTEYPI